MGLEDPAGGVEEVIDLWVSQTVVDDGACQARVDEVLHPKDR